MKGEFICLVDVEVAADDEDEIELSVWRNPQTGKITALDTMNLPFGQNFFYDSYTGQKIQIEDTFSGLPT